MTTSAIEEIREAILDYQTSLQQAILDNHTNGISTVKVGDRVTGSYMHTFESPSKIESVKSSRGSSHLFIRWRVANVEHCQWPDISMFCISTIPSFCFSPTGDQIAVWAHRSRWSMVNPGFRVFNLYDVSSGYLLAQQAVECPVVSISFLTDGERALSWARISHFFWFNTAALSEDRGTKKAANFQVVL